MKKRISFTAYLDIDFDDYDEDYREDMKSWKFKDFEEADYDSIERPLIRLEDEGWVITKKNIKDIK